MIKRSIQEIDSNDVKGKDTKGVAMKLLVGREDNAPTFAMRHFKIEVNGHTPKHHHPWEHEVLILSGEGELECSGKISFLKAGDSLYIPSEELHQFRNISTMPLEFLCIVRVESDCGKIVPGS